MGERTELTPEALLAHAGWLRRLAASLVSDPGAADDVVQDTYLAALRFPPAVGRPLQPWLARVARNFALRRRRGEQRRVTHEGTIEPPCEAPTPAQTVERLDLQRTVVEAVLAIDEPFRTTLVERYLEGHSAVEIARRLRVPEGTVRWRLKRGLDELRERLDRRFGGREGWCVLLAPLARDGSAIPGTAATATAPSLLTAGLAMGTVQWTAITAGVVLVLAGGWWSLARRGGDGEPARSVTVASPGALAAPLEPASSVSAEDAPTSGGEGRESAPRRDGEPRPPAAQPIEARTAAVEARFVDEHGTPWAGVHFEVHDEAWPVAEWGPPVASLADGRARLELVFPELRDGDGLLSTRTLTFVARRDGCTTVVRRALVRVGETTHLGEVVLGPGVRLAGRILDEAGRGIADATVGTTAAELPPEEDGRLRRHGSKAFTLPVTTSALDGSFVLEGVGAGTCRLGAHAVGTRYGWSEPLAVTAERDLLGLELVLTPLLATDRIEGRIVDPSGAPFRAGLSSLVHDARHGGFGRGERVDEQGRFSILVEHDGEIWDLTAIDFTGRFATTSVLGVRAGTLDLVLRMQEPRFLEVEVRDSAGQAVEDAAFLVGVGGTYSDPGAEASAPGRYRVPVPTAKFRMEVSAPGFRAENRPRTFDPATLPAELEVVLRRAPLVRGRVVADGRAIPGAHVELRTDDPAALETFDGFRCVMASMANVEGSTDADGRFELACDLDGAFWIRATAAGLAPTEVGPLDAAGLGARAEFELVLDPGGVIEGRVLQPEGVPAEGTIVAINHGDGAPRTVRAGPGGSFRFEGLAVGRWQVLARDTEVDPTRGTYSSLDDAEPIEWSCEVFAGRITRHDLDLRPK